MVGVVMEVVEANNTTIHPTHIHSGKCTGATPKNCIHVLYMMMMMMMENENELDSFVEAIT